MTEVKKGNQKLLIQIVGRKIQRSKLTNLALSSLNQGDVFILDAGQTIYQWHGASCNRMQKAYALDLSSRIRFKERAGLAKVVLMEDDQSQSKNFFV
jgi:hypothetical protein